MEAAGITATLSGGAAVTVYSANEYGSRDLDFVTSEALAAISAAIKPLGFYRGSHDARQFDHAESQWYVEFPPGPLAFGEMVLDPQEVPVLQTDHGPLRIVTPTHIIMDRLAAYVHWKDGQSWDQAVIVAKRQHVNWPELEAWAQKEGVDPGHIQRLCEKAGKGEHDRGSGCGPSTA